MLDDIRVGLRDLGLSAKAVNMYLSLLELGASNVQDLATKANINRTTAYVVLDELKEFSLVTTVEKEGKTLFSPETPDRLVMLAKDRLTNAQACTATVESMIPRLTALYQSHPDRPRARYLEGEGAMHIARQEIIDAKQPVWEFVAIDESLHTISELNAEHRVQASIATTGRAIIAIKEGQRVPYIDVTKYETRICDYATHPFSGCLTFVEDRMYMFSTKSRGIGLVVESAEMIGVFRAMYEHVWDVSKPWTPPEHWPKQ